MTKMINLNYYPVNNHVKIKTRNEIHVLNRVAKIRSFSLNKIIDILGSVTLPAYLMVSDSNFSRLSYLYYSIVMLIIQCSKVSSSHKNYKRTAKNGFLCKMWRVGFFLSAVLQISTAQFLDGFGKILFSSTGSLNGF